MTRQSSATCRVVKQRLCSQTAVARRRRCWSQKDFAGLLRVSVSTVRRIERGEPGVALTTLMHVALLLGLMPMFRRLLAAHLQAASAFSESKSVNAAVAPHELAKPAALASLPIEVRLILPQGPYGPRLSHRLRILLGERAIVLGELRARVGGQRAALQDLNLAAWKSYGGAVTASPQRQIALAHPRRRSVSSVHRQLVATLRDSAPSGFGAKVVHQCRREGLLEAFRVPGHLPSEFDELCAVPDMFRLGALRLCPVGQVMPDAVQEGFLLPSGEASLSSMQAFITSFERGDLGLRGLLLLLYGATALGGLRPKCTWIDRHGQLLVAKFPSVLDEWAVIRAETLIMFLARCIGIDAVETKLAHPVMTPILVAPRFDRAQGGMRRPYLSAHSVLKGGERIGGSMLDLLEAMQRMCANPKEDRRQLWMRLVFKRLINDQSDDLSKIGFLYAGGGRWCLAPACGLRTRPAAGASVKVPGKAAARLTSLQELVEHAPEFGVSSFEVRPFLRWQLEVISTWKSRATEFQFNMNAPDIARLEQAMHTPQRDWALEYLRS